MTQVTNQDIKKVLFLIDSKFKPSNGFHWDTVSFSGRHKLVERDGKGAERVALNCSSKKELFDQMHAVLNMVRNYEQYKG